MNKNKILFTEKELSDLALETYKKNINSLQSKESFINKLPYSDDYPRLFGNKWSICQSLIQKNLIYVFAFSILALRPWTISKYNFLYPTCQAINRGDMGISTLEEETFKYLIEKCDIYDHIDAILDLKDKYSLYEFEQIQKEWKLKKMNIVVENMEKIRENTKL